MIPEKFCIVPWIHLNPEPSGNVKPCCAYSDNQDEILKLQDYSLEEIWNHERQKNIRRQFLNNEMPKGCATCIQRENSNGHSYRMAMNERFEKHIEPSIENTKPDGTYDNFNLVFWDFRFSNICNFKCRMCGHGCSSSWHDDLDKESKSKLPKIIDSSYHGKDLMKYVDQFIDVVEEIYFAGGEPLLMTEHYQILDKLIEKERYDVFLRYNTNLSTIKYKSYDLIEIWRKFKNVHLFLSLDGFGENAEYSRSGTNWARVESNLKELLDSKLPIVISLTLNIFNVFHLPDFIDKLKEIHNNDPLRYLLINNLIWPSYYRIGILSDDLKQKVRDKYTAHLETLTDNERHKIKPMYDQVFYYLNMDSNDTDLRHFLQETEKLDGIRNENIVDVIPEYQEWYSELKKRFPHRWKMFG